jgi:hypothetical protein
MAVIILASWMIIIVHLNLKKINQRKTAKPDIRRFPKAEAKAIDEEIARLCQPHHGDQTRCHSG